MDGALRRRALAAAGTIGVCIVAGCGGGKTALTTTSTAPTVPSSSTTSTTVVAAPAQPCTTTQLSVSIGASTSASGGRQVPFVVRDAATGTCTLHGYFGLALVNAKGQPLGTSPAQTPGLVAPAGAPSGPVSVGGAATAQFLFEWPGSPTPGQSCPAASSVELTAPGQTDHLTVAARTADGTTIALCGPATQIGPVTSSG